MYPSTHQAWNELASGHWAAALALCEPSLSSEGTSEALHIAGLALWGLGNAAAAVDHLTRAVALSAGDFSLLSDLGGLRFLQEDWSGAAHAFQESLRLRPAYPTALRGYAESLLRLRRYREARQVSEEWVRAAPSDASALRVLAQCMAVLGEEDRAAQVLQSSLVMDPGHVRALLLLAAIRQKQKRFHQALEHTLEAARGNPASFTLQARLAMAYWDAGDLEEALATRANALRLEAAGSDLAIPLDWLALHDPAQTASGLLEIHRASTAALYPQQEVTGPFANDRNPDRRLRIGYLSGEFGSNAAYWFLTPWLGAHDPHEVETFYYMAGPTNDEHTADYQRFAHHWSEVSHSCDDEVASRIRSDGIDILVDLSGHFAYHRLGVFARRPAPVQVTFPNYPSSTGVDAIDYILTDGWNTPPGTEDEYCEEPYRLPSGYLVFRTPPSTVSVPPSPAQSNGYVTFGLFQRPSKFHAGFWDVACAILRQLPNSRLLVHFASAELEEDGGDQRVRILSPLAGRGIGQGRVRFRGTLAALDHLAAVAEADIALDTFPYNGQTTTCDCLWMGVPVVTMRGHTHVSRVGQALLERLRLDCLVATTQEEYVEITLALARDSRRLSTLRQDLRSSMVRNNMTNGTLLAREIEAAYRAMWRRWCASGVGETG